MTYDILRVLLALLAGIVLGLIFYGGLWWTVRNGVNPGGRLGKGPALWFLGSHILRTVITLIGFYFVSSGDWKRLLSCFAGFVLGRVVVTRFTREPKVTQRFASGGSHAT